MGVICFRISFAKQFFSIGFAVMFTIQLLTDQLFHTLDDIRRRGHHFLR
jgi:hypothetical protein